MGSGYRISSLKRHTDRNEYKVSICCDCLQTDGVFEFMAKNVIKFKTVGDQMEDLTFVNLSVIQN